MLGGVFALGDGRNCQTEKTDRKGSLRPDILTVTAGVEGSSSGGCDMAGFDPAAV